MTNTGNTHSQLNHEHQIPPVQELHARIKPKKKAINNFLLARLAHAPVVPQPLHSKSTTGPWPGLAQTTAAANAGHCCTEALHAEKRVQHLHQQ
jgi:hypothetical protein